MSVAGRLGPRLVPGGSLVTNTRLQHQREGVGPMSGTLREGGTHVSMYRTEMTDNYENITFGKLRLRAVMTLNPSNVCNVVFCIDALICFYKSD